MMFLWVMCAWVLLRTNTVCGQDTGTFDSNCQVGCACCKDRHCGPLGYWPEGNCYSGCKDGYRGGRCTRKCDYPECAECPDLAYVCTRCKAGYYHGLSNNCSSKCPITCKSCTSSTYCTECIDEYYNSNGFNDCRYRYCPLHCKCEHNACVSCKEGYFNIDSSCISKCPSTCVSCSAKDKCSSCIEGKYNGYEFDKRDRLLLNNCTHGCRENCISCSSYNNCSQCEPGKFGMTCQRDCSIGCENKICQIESGNCTCKTNFSGRNCTDCIPGKFGTSCEKTCPMFCKNKRCDKSSGNCLDGCILAAIIGETCNACVNGSYGDACNATCPNNCKDVNCERDNGECSYGCKDNFSGKKCEACKDGKYGKSCNLTCPQNCADDKCNKTSGHCFACRGNYYGNKCNNCTKGYYGSSCNDECSSQCWNGVCNRATGNCDLGCKGKYSGDKCCMEGGNCLVCSSNTECSKCKPGYFSEHCYKACPSNCLDSCELLTGVCYSCKNNLYGLFCNASCSLSCKLSQYASVSNCESQYGNCIHGCVKGFFGSLCNMSCNSQCIDNLCIQDDGKCTKGCYKPSDDHVCHLGSEKQKSEDSKQTIIIVMGVVVALLLVVVISFIASKIVAWKRKSMERNPKDAMVSSEIETSSPNIEHRRSEGLF
ncbi:multiple epidermal growth factor-like domains protein 10 [Mercenaria mercenaria]|uniref:multiple epidermal growth factor-like domains protein 10 n=1 Tax=Mercenaria mercenaria TaxID=6596 RepID=UPI00234E88B6|nr:multiple epidermal growth factor-like domains protein 10 [Mercenaria mercenaria]